ncbi:protein kinase [Nocardia sp. NPDC004860]|uniref:protein kinase domain-containing protein n=1 Tax=Nocardia sp. NPDC004860 TaxID=3154557 RepID=UPI0033A0472E
MADPHPLATQRDRPPDIDKELEDAGFDTPRIVGQGGFGIVYRCRQPALSRDVAVKVLTARPELDPENVERFLREQHAMGALSGHPNIVPVLEAGTTSHGQPYLVMPYHSHGSLHARIRRDGRLPLEEALRITVKLAGALETAHRAGILHRDIKPDNVLLTDYGEPQLTDFGIARIDGGFETTTGVVTGSPAFTAPEVLRRGVPTAASDVYGLGATLFCMITGHAAYERRSGEQLVAQFLRIAGESTPDLRPDGIPDDVCAAIEASMSHNPSDRPKSAAEFGELLRTIQGAHGMLVETMMLPADGDLVDQHDGGLAEEIRTGRARSLRRTPTPPTPDTKYRPTTSARAQVQRDRLLELLRTDVRPRLIVIHAPAGFGKSTLAVQWARYLDEDQHVAVAWLNADHDDNNPVWFLTHLVEAVHRACPELAPGLVSVLEEQGEQAMRSALTTLINDIHSRRTRVAVVIEDWHRVTDAKAVGALRFLLENGCHHLQIIVTSRSLEGLPLATMRVRRELIEIDSTALRFDVTEAKAFLVELGGLGLDAAAVTKLRDCTEGWAAALQLASLSLAGHSDPTALIGQLTGRHHSIAEYLAENVLDAVSPELLDVLLETSLPERICGSLVTALTGRPCGHELLEDIERRNLFLRRVDEDGEWFRYHHLFAQFLRQRLERRGPGPVAELHRAAATWFGDHEMLSEAIDHWSACGDTEQAVDLIDARAAGLVQHAQFATLCGLAAKLPPAQTSGRPRLQLALAWAHALLRQPDDLHAALRLARGALESGEADPDLLFEADLIDCVEAAFADHIDERVDTLVADCLSRTATLTPWVLCAAANLAAYLSNCRFEYDRAREWLDWAAPYHRQISGTFSLMYSHCLAGVAAREQLDINAAERSFRRALEIARADSGAQSYEARLAGAMLGDLLYDRDQLDTAEQLLDAAFELGIQGGPVEFLMAIYATGSRIKALRGDLEAATRRLDQGAQIARTLMLPRLAARIADERVRLGLTTTATNHTEPPTAGDGIARLTAELHEDAAIRSLLLSGTPTATATACARAAALRDSIDADRRPRTALSAQLLHAACLAAAGRTTEAENALIPVLVSCADIGLIRPLCDDSPQITALLRALDTDLSEGRWETGRPEIPARFLTIVLNAGNSAPLPATRAPGLR